MLEPGSRDDADASESPHGRSVGRRVPRIEDGRLLRGQGRFVDDVDLVGQAWLRVVRSPLPHARVVAIDAEAARSMPGVRLVVLPTDVAHLANIPLEEIGYHEVFPDLEVRAHPILAQTRVHYVGQPVAAVVADDPYAAEDAAELIVIEYDALPVLLDPVEAANDAAPQLHEQATNVGARFDRRYGDVEGAFARAAHRVSAELRTGRHTGAPLETRGCVAEPDLARGDLFLWGPVHVHDSRRIIAKSLGLPEQSIRMRNTDIGGNFGVRGGAFPEYVLVAHAARLLGRPVKWVEDRAEHMVATSHAREQVHRIEGAFDEGGRLLAVRDEIWHNHGAFFRQAEPLISDITVGSLPGPYRVPAFDGVLHAVHTNKTPSGAYRAPGRYENTFARERLLDIAAEQIGIDSVEIRRRNLLASSDLPWEPGIEMVFESFRFDSGDVLRHFEQALAASGFETWKDEAAELRAAGRLVGAGLGALMDKAGLGLYETAACEVLPTGQVRVLTGASSVGQGVETVLAQVVADVLTVQPNDVVVLHGDTDLVPDGVGSWSSRSTVIAGGAARNASLAVIEKARRIAGGLLEVDQADLELIDGRLRVVGSPDRSITLGEIAGAWDGWTARSAGDEPGLSAKAVYVEHHMNYPYGVTFVQLEIDPETGGHSIHRFFTTCEAGRMINPLTTEGQIIGAAAQGIGGALFEELAYDGDGQPLATTFMDYLLPTACDVPIVELMITEDAPTPDNPFGAKGLGEVGLIAVGAAVAAAVDDAVGRPGAVRSLPLLPHHLWALAQERAPIRG